MNFNGVWMLTQYQQQAGLNFGVAPFPMLGTQDHKTWGGASHLALPVQRRANPAAQSAAMKFIGWMTQPAQDLTWTTAGSLPTQPAVADSAGYQGNPMKAAKEGISGIYILSGFPFISQLRAAWDAAFESAILGKKPVMQALNDGAAEATSRIKDALRSLPPQR